jgi:hypothetical protein
MTARGTAAELGEIDDAGKRFAGNDPAECRAHGGGDRHVGVAAAEDDDGITGGGSIGTGAQSPPDPEGIDDRYTGASVEQALDESFGGIGLPRTGGADDGDAVVESCGGDSERLNFSGARLDGSTVAPAASWP